MVLICPGHFSSSLSSADKGVRRTKSVCSRLLFHSAKRLAVARGKTEPVLLWGWQLSLGIAFCSPDPLSGTRGSNKNKSATPGALPTAPFKHKAANHRDKQGRRKVWPMRSSSEQCQMHLLFMMRICGRVLSLTQCSCNVPIAPWCLTNLFPWFISFSSCVSSQTQKFGMDPVVVHLSAF